MKPRLLGLVIGLHLTACAAAIVVGGGELTRKAERRTERRDMSAPRRQMNEPTLANLKSADGTAPLVIAIDQQIGQQIDHATQQINQRASESFEAVLTF